MTLCVHTNTVRVTHIYKFRVLNLVHVPVGTRVLNLVPRVMSNENFYETSARVHGASVLHGVLHPGNFTKRVLSTRSSKSTEIYPIKTFFFKNLVQSQTYADSNFDIQNSDGLQPSDGMQPSGSSRLICITIVKRIIIVLTKP